MRIYDIEWDTDGEYMELPETIILPFHLFQDDIEGYLSETYGCCVKDFRVDALDNGKEKEYVHSNDI